MPWRIHWYQSRQKFSLFPKEKWKWLFLKYSKLIRCLISYCASPSILMKEQDISHHSAKLIEFREVNYCCYGNKGPADCFSWIIWNRTVFHGFCIYGKPAWLQQGLLPGTQASLLMVFVPLTHSIISVLSVIPSSDFPYSRISCVSALISHPFLSFLCIIRPPKYEIFLKWKHVLRVDRTVICPSP